MQKFTKAIAALMLMTTALLFTMGCNKKNNDSDVKVTTYTPQDITQTTAKCGGDVIVTQGLTINELGVCWSTGSKPTVEDSHQSTFNWNEPYVYTITGLEPGKTYHVRAYALRGLEYYYGEDKSFTTENNGANGGGGNGSYNGHDYVDLGLPSGTLWATCNVGATTPEGYSEYFAWGETQPKTIYDWSTYKYCNGYYDQLTKYCDNYDYGYNGFTDNLTMLLPEDDAATVNWGSGWRMPTYYEWNELLDYCTQTWTDQPGVNGLLLTAPNGNSIFLPAAGHRIGSGINFAGINGVYWSSSLHSDSPNLAWDFYFLSDVSGMNGYNFYYRDYGRSVRAVRSTTKN